MEQYTILLFLLIIVQRIGELFIAKSNRKWMLERGAKEFGADHYVLFVTLHCLFILSIALEYVVTPHTLSVIHYFSLAVFLILQPMRVWCMITLGRRWNTRIIVLPEDELIKKGLYRYVSHPNYMIVFFELIVIPLMFGAYMTAIIFPVLHLLLLAVRIPAEEKALNERF